MIVGIQISRLIAWTLAARCSCLSIPQAPIDREQVTEFKRTGCHNRLLLFMLGERRLRPLAICEAVNLQEWPRYEQQDPASFIGIAGWAAVSFLAATAGAALSLEGWPQPHSWPEDVLILLVI